MKTYYKGYNIETGRLTIVINRPLSAIPFNVWRDIGNLSGMSVSTKETEYFEFLGNNSLNVVKAESVLKGARFTHE